MSRSLLMDEFDSWQKRRLELAQEEDAGTADPDDWVYSDDEAVELLYRFADQVRREMKDTPE